jgi:hypothetical protein
MEAFFLKDFFFFFFSFSWRWQAAAEAKKLVATGDDD